MRVRGWASLTEGVTLKRVSALCFALMLLFLLVYNYDAARDARRAQRVAEKAQDRLLDQNERLILDGIARERQLDTLSDQIDVLQSQLIALGAEPGVTDDQQTEARRGGRGPAGPPGQPGASVIVPTPTTTTTAPRPPPTTTTTTTTTTRPCTAVVPVVGTCVGTREQ